MFYPVKPNKDFLSALVVLKKKNKKKKTEAVNEMEQMRTAHPHCGLRVTPVQKK